MTEWEAKPDRQVASRSARRLVPGVTSADLTPNEQHLLGSLAWGVFFHNPRRSGGLTFDPPPLRLPLADLIAKL